MDFIKKQSIGTWITLGALVLTIVSAIIYGAHIGIKGGTFYGATVGTLVICTIIAILLLAAVLVLAQFKFEGILGKVIDVLCDACKIVAPVLLMLGLITFIGSRVEGLAFVYFSAEGVLASVQTPANLASAQSGIVGFVFYGISALVAIVAAFFGMVKKDA